MGEIRRRVLLKAAGGAVAAAAAGGELLGSAGRTDAASIVPRGAYQVVGEPRTTWSLNQGWKFLLGDPTDAQQPSFDDSGWDAVDTPHPLKLQPIDVGLDNVQAVAWYRRQVTVPDSMRGRRLLLRFEGAMQVADVWIDGDQLGTHYGGFTPFGWDITGQLQPGRESVLAVRLDNTDQPAVPPGKPQAQLDFDYFGGLYRDVWLIGTSPIHVTEPIIEGRVAGGGVFVTTPDVTANAATVNVATDVVNKGTTDASVAVRTVIVDAVGSIVATGDVRQPVAAGATAKFAGVFTVRQPKLWSPDTPYLYTAHVEVRLDGQLIDRVSTRFGIRTMSWGYTTGFRLNDTKVLLNGTDRGHQEYPYVGYAAPASQQRRDALLIRESGANFVRSAHYPPDPAFLDACDEVGLMVMNCVPGWQYWNNDPEFAQRSHDDLRMMIRRDRNHPSVILWEATLNETYTGNTPFESEQWQIAHEEYPGDQMFAYGGNGAYDPGRSDALIFEVQNAYWVRPDPSSAPIDAPPAALLWREYGDWEFGGNGNNTSRTTRADGPQAMLGTVHNKQSEFSLYQTPGYFGSGVLSGVATWSAFDYNRGSDSKSAYSGLMDLFRIPKFVYYFYQSQRDPHRHQVGVASGPMLYLANWWVPPPPPPYEITISHGTTGTGDGQWQYTGDWQGVDGDNAYSDQAGDTAVLRFSGKAVTLYGDLDYVHGIAAITLDSGAPQNVDFYKPSRQNQVAVWSASGLTDGPHTLTVKVTGTKNPASGGTFVALTQATVTTGTIPAALQRVVVFSNCDQVELRRNGKVLARQGPDTGGINVYVPHPPFTFEGVAFETGALQANGYLGGELVAAQTVRTPEAAAKIEVSVDLPERRLVADGVDFAVVRAAVVDSHGTVVPGNDVPVSFSVDGPADLIGDPHIGANPVTATAGIAAALVRAGYRPGPVTITASAPGLAAGHATITTAPDLALRL